MRDRMERLVVLPFSAGCISQASVDVVALHQHQPPSLPKRSSKPRITLEDDDQETFSSKNSLTLLPLPKPNNNNISTGFHRLLKTFKNISQLFEYKDETDGEEDMEIQIGFPTDVKHVTHIGIDGCAASSTMIGRWDSLIAQGQDFMADHAPHQVI